jgi:hypothetical protein
MSPYRENAAPTWEPLHSYPTPKNLRRAEKRYLLALARYVNAGPIAKPLAWYQVRRARKELEGLRAMFAMNRRAMFAMRESYVATVVGLR